MQSPRNSHVYTGTCHLPTARLPSQPAALLHLRVDCTRPLCLNAYGVNATSARSARGARGARGAPTRRTHTARTARMSAGTVKHSCASLQPAPVGTSNAMSLGKNLWPPTY